MNKKNQKTKEARVFVIGLDGATFDLIKPWVAAGKLPNFEKIMSEGSYGELRSTIHPLTAQAWSSFMTGKNPGKHGIFDFTSRKLNSYETIFMNSTFRQSDSLWKILSNNQKRVGVFHVPMTYPIEKVNGFIIAGNPAPGKNSDFTYPSSLYEEIINKFGKYELLEFSPQTMNQESCINFLRKLIKDTVSITKYLMKKYDWAFFITVFMATDHIQHLFWHYMDPRHPMYNKEDNKKYGNAVLEIYQEIDLALEELMKELPENTITIIMSDHGAGPVKKNIYLNRWCKKIGLLSYKKEKNIFKKIFSQILGNIRIQARYYLPRKWKNEIERLTSIRKRLDSHLISTGIDWENTKCYSGGFYGNIYINLKGREPQGIVEESEYEELRDYIIEQLYLLEDPENQEKVIQKVYKREELYHGPFVHYAPDLIATYKDYAYVSKPELKFFKKKEIFEKTDEGYHPDKLSPFSFHKLNGISLFYGEPIKRNVEVENARIIDLAPTILYLMGTPIPKDMDGQILFSVIKDEFFQSNPVKYQDICEKKPLHREKRVFSRDEAKEIEEKLRGLGYLD